MSASNTLEFTDANFESKVLESSTPVLVDFWGEHCPPCRALAPMIDEIADQYAGKVKVGKLDIGQHLKAAMSYNVAQIPTVLIFNNGEVIERYVGIPNRTALAAVLENAAT